MQAAWLSVLCDRQGFGYGVGLDLPATCGVHCVFFHAACFGAVGNRSGQCAFGAIQYGFLLALSVAVGATSRVEYTCRASPI